MGSQGCRRQRLICTTKWISVSEATCCLEHRSVRSFYSSSLSSSSSLESPANSSSTILRLGLSAWHPEGETHRLAFGCNLLALAGAFLTGLVTDDISVGIMDEEITFLLVV